MMLKSDKQAWDAECSIINPKYQISATDAYEFVQSHSSRVIQLPTIAKLTTDNNSIISDFPIDYSIRGMEPYNEYAIKVCDACETELYIFVHHKGSTTYLCPVVSGFADGPACAPLNLTNNGRTRSIFVDGILFPEQDKEKCRQIREDFVQGRYRPDGLYAVTEAAWKEFGLNGLMIVVDTAGKLYGDLSVLTSPSDKDLLAAWRETEKTSLNPRRVTTFSSCALVFQIWLYTICMWRKRCLNRQVKIVHSDRKTEYTENVRQATKNLDKQVIVDINKDIIVYVNENMSKREFRGYHMFESSRCGHFRHLKGDRITYIPPTTVHYKKLVPELTEQNQGKRAIVYRNTEDFLKGTQHLINDVAQMLKNSGINFKQRHRFSWMQNEDVDFYLPDKNIVIECLGVDHFYSYGAGDKNLRARQQKDEDRYRQCKENDIKVVYFVSSLIPIPKDMAERHQYITGLSKLHDLVRSKRRENEEM